MLLLSVHRCFVRGLVPGPLCFSFCLCGMEHPFLHLHISLFSSVYAFFPINLRSPHFSYLPFSGSALELLVDRTKSISLRSPEQSSMASGGVA